MLDRCFWQHLILLSLAIWSVRCGEGQCVCKMCPQFSTPGAHCGCCVWHYYGKRGVLDAETSIGSASLPPTIAEGTARAQTASGGDNIYFDDTPCRSVQYSIPYSRIRFSASLKTIKHRLRCLLWLTKNQQGNQSSFFLWRRNRKKPERKKKVKMNIISKNPQNGTAKTRINL